MNPLQRWHVRRDVDLTLRPARPDDAAALGALIESLPLFDRRLRFHGTVNGLAGAALERWTTPDPQREVALVVCAREGDVETLVADARYTIDAAGDGAECALMVAPGWRRRGIGVRCMHALRTAAHHRGLRWLYGSVLAENTPMLALAQRCGFVVARSRAARGMMTIETRVDTADCGPSRRSLRAVLLPYLRRISWRVAAA